MALNSKTNIASANNLKNIYTPQYKVENILNNFPQIKKAYNISKKAHKTQFRASGDPYITHLTSTANTIISWVGLSPITEKLIIAALLHDITEETDTTLQDLSKLFGGEIANLVDGVSKFKSDDKGLSDRKTHEKIVTLGYIDPRIFILKLADRLHNMNTLKYLPRRKQKIKALETRNVYAPLAESLGMWKVKCELEDLSFRYLNRKTFKKIKHFIDKDKRYIKASGLSNKVKSLLAENNIENRISLVKNGYFAIYQKLQAFSEYNKPITESLKEIDDLISIRIEVKDNMTCFSVLGLIEDLFSKSINITDFDNYLTQPSINGYSALHTSVVTKDGLIEISISTYEKERFNQLGILSALRNSGYGLKKYLLKIIFTKDDEIIFMPKNATGIDFLYLHPHTAPNATNIKINGKIYPVETLLPNGAVIEAVYGRKILMAPPPSYLEHALPETQILIRGQQELQNKFELIERGEKIFSNILKPRGIISLDDVPKIAWRLTYLLNLQSIDELLIKVASGKIMKKKIQRNLDHIKVTKEDLKLTSISVSGKNQPGILANISGKIARYNGNIISYTQNTPGKSFSIRFLIQGLDKKSEDKIAKFLAKDIKFKSFEVV